jgi:hypothetical protein
MASALWTHNAPPAYAKARASLVHPHPDTSSGRAARTKQVAQIIDITTTRPYLEGDSFVVTAAKLGGYRTILSVPMLNKEELEQIPLEFTHNPRA